MRASRSELWRRRMAFLVIGLFLAGECAPAHADPASEMQPVKDGVTSASRLYGVLPPALAGDVQRVRNGVQLEGPLTDDTYQRAAAMLRDGDTLQIISFVGYPEAALRFAHLVHDRHIHVRAIFCTDLCASHVFLPAASRDMDQTSRVAFGAPIEMFRHGLTQAKDKSDPDELNQIDAYIAEYEAVLVGAGVNPRIFKCIEAALQPRFDTLKRGDTIGTARPFSRDLNVKLRKDLVLLSGPALAQFGAESDGAAVKLTARGRKAAAHFYSLRVGTVNDARHCKAR
jgi:hypothetical protein